MDYRLTRSAAVAGICLVLFLAGRPLAAAEAADAQIVGWRGNGSGCYPTARPPTQWGRASTGLKQIRYQAAKPKGDASAGRSLSDGVIRQWLVLGPVAVPAGAKADTAKFEMIKGEADLAPDAGDKVGRAAWKTADSEDEMLDFASLWGKKTDVVAYAAVYLWSPADQTLLLDINSSASTLVWVNGKEALRISEKSWPIGFQQANLPLKKGWNRLVIRIMASTGWNAYAWFMRPVFYGDPRGPYETKNVRWTAPIGGMAEPIVVGQRLFLLSEPYDLVCLDKTSGKILWARSVNYFEATPEADRKGNPLFDEAAKLAAELNRINDAYGTPAGPSKEQLAAKAEAQKKLYETMVKIDPPKYTLTRQQDFGMAGFVPMSDGKNVWAWFASGITACYDLDGNRRWITLDNRPGEQHHGYQTSPLLVGGKVILYMYDIEALDAKTGKVAWTRPICKDPKNEHWWSAIGGGFCALNIGGVPMFMTSNTDIYRTADGQQVFLDNPMAYYQLAAPVVDGNTVCNVKNDGRVYILKLPAEAADRIRPLSSKQVKLNTSECRMFYQDSLYWGGPVLSDGLLYCMKHTGVLSVVDVEKAAVVYQKKLDVDLDAFMRPSLAKAGKYLYALGPTGTCAVFECGREFKLVAKNRLEPVLNAGTGNPRLERFTADPILDGKRVYLRGESHLYCIEEK